MEARLGKLVSSRVYMKIFQPAWPGWLNRGKFDFKMARNTSVILKIFCLTTVQLAVYMTMVMQLHGLIFCGRSMKNKETVR